MAELAFMVKGSGSDPYEVVFLRKDTKVSALCTCQAGQNGQHCKHRISLLQGDASAALDVLPEQMVQLQQWLVGSNLEAPLAKLATAETEPDKAKKKADVMTAKKALARAMR
jgi:uncharacterized Zn finger protein